MATNVQVKKKPNENSIALIKRFTKKVQNSGVLPKVRSLRYEDRKPSDYTKKKAKLKSLGNKANYDNLFKLGKISGYNNRG